jgi:hypothetical protein
MTESDHLQQKVECLEQEVARLKEGAVRRGVRKRSGRSFWGLPLYDIALGPDPDRQEVRGHARGVIAIGDIATGFVALGGVARGVIALGGVAVGGFCIGGCALGLVAVGGLAVGACAVGGLAIGLVALGGGAVGLVAVGGGAFGYYACGGGACGKYVLDAAQRDPEAVRFFSQWFPGLRGWLN